MMYSCFETEKLTLQKFKILEKEVSNTGGSWLMEFHESLCSVIICF